MGNVIENSFWIFFLWFETIWIKIHDLWRRTCGTWKPFFFFNSSVLRKKKICLLCGAAYQWRFFLYVVEFCWSHFRDRQISLVETGTFPDFRKKICRLVTQFERFQRNRLGPPIAEKLFKRKTKQNKQSCFCPCKRIGRNWSKVNDRYIR